MGRPTEVVLSRHTSHALAARIGGLVTSSRYDGRTLTASARLAYLARFIDQVDPDRLLPEAERHRRASAALKAHMARLALRSAAMRARSTRPRPTKADVADPRASDAEEPGK